MRDPRSPTAYSYRGNRCFREGRTRNRPARSLAISPNPSRRGARPCPDPYPCSLRVHRGRGVTACDLDPDEHERQQRLIHTLNHDHTSSAAPSRHARRERGLSYHSRLVRVHALRFQSDNIAISLMFFSCNPPAYRRSRERHRPSEASQRTEVSGMAFESARRHSGGRSDAGRFG